MLLRSQKLSAPQQNAAPQPSNILQYFLLAVVFAAVMDIWFDLEAGMSLPQMVLRHLGWLITKGGR